MKTQYTFDEICDSQDFNHDDIFIPKARVEKLIEAVDAFLKDTQAKIDEAERLRLRGFQFNQKYLAELWSARKDLGDL